MATISSVIAQVDAIKPNQYTALQKIQWLSECDSMVFSEVIAKHAPDNDAPSAFIPYEESTDPDTTLLARPPHDVIYRHYLTAQIDLANQELLRYNNSSAMFNTAYQAFRAWYTRCHMPLGSVTHFTL